MRVDPGEIAYGTITIGAVLATESAARETYPETVAAVLVALGLYWLAHSYAELTRRRARQPGAVTLGVLRSVLIHEAGILAGAGVPLVALMISWAAGAKLTTAVTTTTWVAAGMVVILELGLAVRERLTAAEAAAQTAVGALLGLLVILLRALLH